MFINSTKQSLLNLPRSIKKGLVIFADVFICAISVWMAFGLRLDRWSVFEGGQWLALVFAIGISFPIFISFGLYRAIFRYFGSAAFNSIGRAFAVYGTLFFCIFTLIGFDDVPRSIGVIQPVLLFIGIGISRYFVRFWLGSFNNVQKSFHRAQPVVLIYGAGSAGRQLLAGLASNKEMLVKGFVDDDLRLQGSTINGVTVYGSKDLQKLIHKLDITDVLLAIPSADQGCRNKIISSLNGCGVRVRTLPGLIDLASGRVRISDLHELDMNDLLGREVVPPVLDLLEKNIRGKVVLVTGAGGSIGSELCRQINKFSPQSLILVDNNEYALYLIYEELKQDIIRFEADRLVGGDDHPASAQYGSIQLVPCLASIRDEDLIRKIWGTYLPSIVFHAAAYKHVPLVEQNPAEGIHNNVFGTIICANASLEYRVSHFVLVSTDKAVRPTNVMGASKRIAELVLQALAERVTKNHLHTKFSIVRFGNVLGSSGSVAPLFSSQITAGGPITLTHPEVTRYFMTIPEAAQLVIQAGAMAEGGDVFVLDMGQPVRIYDLAVKMIYLSGLLIKDEKHPHGDIEIKITGLRPGEKLYEELLIGDNPQPTAHSKIMKAHEDFISWDELNQKLEKLDLALGEFDDEAIAISIKHLVPGYQPKMFR